METKKNKKPLILVADDDTRHREIVSTLLKESGYDTVCASDGEEAVRYGLMDKKAPDLALLDMRMPRGNGLEAMLEIKAKRPDLPVIIMTAYSEIEAAVDAIRKGAYDYLTKPLEYPKLEVAVRNALVQSGLERENASLAASLEARDSRYELLGNSPAMRDLDALIKTIAPSEANILINGESGTGKELAARSIHKASRRASGPFVAINCGALTESILASELFGHEKGAFTGADRKHPGLFLEATGGSIFLDEIGEMPLSMQVKLLRVLQEKEVLSVGGKKPSKIDCRIIAATNRDLAEEIKKGTFREDLYYRLNVVSVTLPPLRDRKEDIPLLAQDFAQRLAKANHKNYLGITPDAMNILTAWKWPGNVRELENVMERAIILMPGEQIGRRELPERIIQAMSGGADKKDAHDTDYDRGCESFSSGGATPTLEDIERMVIMQTLQKVGNNKTEAARLLGITRKTLHARLNRYREQTENEG